MTFGGARTMMEGGPDTETRNTKLIVQLCKLILFVSSVAKEASERASEREKTSHALVLKVKAFR